MIFAASDKARSMNRSCVQCRERKTKCDRLDPCSQCTSKGAECRRELRKKRAKNKRPFPKRRGQTSQTSPASIAPATHTTLVLNEPRSVINAPVSGNFAWAERPMTSASHRSETSHTSSGYGQVITPSTSSSARQYPQHKRQSSSSAMVYEDDAHPDSDYDSSLDSDDSDNEDAGRPDDRLQMLEATQLMLQSAPQYRCPFALKDVYAEWRAMSLDKRRSLLQEIRDALPSAPQTLHLVDNVYLKRLHSLHGNVVHIPTIRVVLNEVLTDSVFEQRDRYAFGHITAALMVVFAALRFAPLERTYTTVEEGASSSAVEPLSQKEVRHRQKKIYLLVKHLMRFESTFTMGSVPELQTAILILACGKGTPAFLDSLADCAVRSAVRMRIHRLGSFEVLHNLKSHASRIVTGEMAVRCWWALVRRDWSQSSKDRSYRIAPSQFNTRQPLNLFDDELMVVPAPRSHLRSTWTHVSYSLATIDFAILTRTLVDQVNSQSSFDDSPKDADGWGLASVFGQRLSSSQRDLLDQTFQSVIAAFPAHYSLEARYDDIQLVDIERWLLHQRLFYVFLTLHMPLVSEANRPHGSLMYMANHILDIQDKVTNVCARLDNSYLTTLQTLRACVVLLLDLFMTEAPVNMSGLSRLMTRKKIATALEKVPMEVLSSTTKLCVRLVKLLMTIEEQHHSSRFQSTASVISEAPGLTSNDAASASPLNDLAALRNRWHATCQILDVLLNDGYWRSFRNNLLQLDHLIPEWLQKPLREDVNTESAESSSSKDTQTPATESAPHQAQSVLIAPSDSALASHVESAIGAGTTEAASSLMSDVGLTIPFDANVLEDLYFSGFDLPDNTSQLPQLDMDLLGQQDFEGMGNSGQMLDFAKMLTDWRAEVPLGL